MGFTNFIFQEELMSIITPDDYSVYNTYKQAVNIATHTVAGKHYQEVHSSFSDGAQLDSFGRLRVSTPTTLFDDKRRYGKGTTIWSEVLQGSATSVHNADTASIDMTVTTTGDVAVRQTRQRYKYQAGKGQLIDMTGILYPQAGTKKQIGYFQCATTGTHQPHDGICFESVDDVVYLVIYNNGTRDAYPQNEWSIDILDGTGPSGIIVDWSKAHIFAIDFQWLGVGRVRYGLNINGIGLFVHEVNHANLVDNVYMRSGTQPLCYRIESTGGAGSLKQICSTVQSQGGSEPTGIVAALDADGIIFTVGTAPQLLLAFRLKSTELDSITEFLSINLLATSNDNIRWSLSWNPPAITGTPNFVPITGASLELWTGSITAGVNLVTEGLLLGSGYFSTAQRGASELVLGNLRLGSTVDGVSDIIALSAQALSGTASVSGGVSLRQFV